MEDLQLSTYEYAAMKTLSKTNNMKIFDIGLSIGPNSNFNYINGADVNNDIDSDIKNVVVPLPLRFKKIGIAEEVHNPKNYAANALHEMDILRRLYVHDTVNKQVEEMNDIEDELTYKMNEKLKLTKINTNSIDKLMYKKIESSIQNEDLAISQQMQKLLNRYSDSLKPENSIKPELEAERKAADLESKKRIERFNELCQIEETYRSIHEKIIALNLNCKNRTKFLTLCNSENESMTMINKNMDYIIEKMKSENLNELDVENGRILVENISNVYERLQKYIDKINEDMEKERLAEKIAKTEKEIKHLKSKNTDNLDKIKTSSTPPPPPSPHQIKLHKHVLDECKNYFSSLNEDSEKLADQVALFAEKFPDKNLLRKLKITLNTTVNTLSSVNISHMREKFLKVSQYLSGNFFIPDISLPNLPKEMYFVFTVDHLTKLFIKHAENLFTNTKPNEAFLLGSFIVALWIDYPRLGNYVMTNIFKDCPYCIPAYWPRFKGQCDEEYYTLIGYRYKNNVKEEEKSFLTRMNGIFMLYLSIMMTPTYNNQPHPYGFKNAWTWLAATLNIEPRPNITATLIHTFLIMAGHKMSNSYKTQFSKIVHLLNQEYMPKIREVTPHDFQAPASRLQILLDDTLRNRSFVEPKGLVNVGDWK